MFAKRTEWALSPNSFAAALEEHRAAGKSLIDLTASNPTEVGLTYEVGSILRALTDPDAMHYRPDAKGLRVAREAVVEYYRSSGHNIHPENVILTASTSEAYSYVFRLLCNPGDEVLVPAPSYPLFEYLADIQDVRLQRYQLFYDHGWHVDAHSLRKNVGPRIRAILAVHPNNPTGSYLKAGEVEEINAICRANDLALVVDEVFRDFTLDARTQPSFANNESALSFTLSGLSKIAGLPQMKFAWLAASGPEGLRRSALARLEVIADTYLSMNAPIQLAAPVLFAQRGQFQHQLMRRMQSNLTQLDRALKAQQACARLHVEGGWYAILRVPVTRTDEDLAIALLRDRGVLVHPGHFYDFPQEGYLVVSLIAREEEFCEGMGRLLGFVAG